MSPSGPRSRTVSRRIAPLALVAGALGAASGCSSPDEEAGTTGCRAAVDAAASAIEIDDQVRRLDEALVRCRSTEILTSELARHPGLIGYSPEAFVTNRCGRIDDPVALAAPVCASVATPTTTAPSTTTVEIVYVGETIDGRTVELRPSGTIEFVGDVPAVIQQTVDIARESGCDGLLEQRDRWLERVDPSAAGDVASVYARHAQNVADYIGCELPPIPDSET